MFIDDLEFISSCTRNSAIDGGVAASASAYSSATDSMVVSDADAYAFGDYGRADTRAGTKLILRGPSRSSEGYAAGYALGDARAYAHDRYYTTVVSESYDLSVV